VRAVLPTSAYSQLSRALDLCCAIQKMGIGQYRNLTASEGPTVRCVTVPGFSHPFWVRSSGTDIDQFIETVARETYGQYFPQGRITSIVDAGANIGDTTVWYLNKFPDATVIAIEPHPGNFEMLKRNCEPYGERVKLVQAALWSESHPISLIENCSDVGHEVREEGGDLRCDAVSVRDLMERFQLNHIDILKCDIEGAEEQLLECPDSWLPLTRSIVIELHTEISHNLMRAAAQRQAWKHLIFRNIHYYF
jgi:FkbM family methyltransferase